MRPTVPLVAIVVAAAWSVSGHAGDGAPPRGPSKAAGAASCRPCHERAYRAWETSAHALTVREARADAVPPEVAAGGAVNHPPGASTFRRVDSRYEIVATGTDGKPTPFPVEDVIGYRRIRMLVGRMGDGRLQILPAMREEPSGVWFDYTHLLFGGPEMDPTTPPRVAPGEDSFWTGPVRSFDAKCVRCHVSGAERTAAGADGRGPRTAWRALGVDCEACHGPAADHAAFWAGLPKDRSKDPIVQTRGLDRERSIATCLRCHLEGDVVRPVDSPDRDPSGDPVSGDPFDEVVPTLLDDVVRVDASGRPLELIYDGLPFSTSTCAERGELTCLTCHDAHGTPFPSQRLAPADGFSPCSRCHADVAAAPASHSHHAAAGDGGSCVACHMPLVPIERGHGAVRDHTIGIPRVAADGVRAAPDACTWCHEHGRGAPAAAPPLSHEQVRAAYERWWPGRGPRPWWTGPVGRARAGDASSLGGLDEILGSSSVPRVVRASAARLLGRFGAAAEARMLSLVEDPDALVRCGGVAALASVRSPAADAALLAALSDASPAVRREAGRAALAGWERAQANRALLLAAVVALEADARAVPDDDRRWFLLGAAKQLAGDVPGAIAAYERQIALDPLAANVRKHVEQMKKKR